MIEKDFHQIIEILKKIDIETNKYKSYIVEISEKHKNLLSKNNFPFYEYSIHLDYMFYYKTYLQKEIDFYSLQKSIILEKLYDDLKNLKIKIIKSLHYFYNTISESEFINSKLKKFNDCNIINNIQNEFHFILTLLEEYKKFVELMMNFIFFNINNNSNLLYDLKKYTETEYTNINTLYLLYNKILKNIIDRTVDMLNDHLDKIIYSNSIIDKNKIEKYMIN